VPLPSIFAADSVKGIFDDRELELCGHAEIHLRHCHRVGAAVKSQAEDIEQMTGETEPGELMSQPLAMNDVA
jgi:hypothetical protein